MNWKLKRLLKILTVLAMLVLMIWAADTAVQPVPDKPYEITNVASGVEIRWEAVKDMEKYGVWRSEDGENGSYIWLANPTSTRYIDKNVDSGKTYFYKLTTVDADSGTHSTKSKATGICYVAAPQIVSRVNRSKGIDIGWQTVEGATGYAIFRQNEGEDEWTQVGQVSGSAVHSWIDESTADADGVVYRYAVRAFAGESSASGLCVARTMVRLATHTIVGAERIDETTVQCKWNTSECVTGYEIRFMVGKDVHAVFRIDGSSTNTSAFGDLEPGETYRVQIRSYFVMEDIGTFYSAWSADVEA